MCVALGHAMRRYRRPERVEQRVGNDLPAVSGTIERSTRRQHARAASETTTKRTAIRVATET
jgi:hypothetical protein